MRFDPVLEDAVRVQAPPGTVFTDAEIRQALHWAVDHRAGAATPLDGWLTTAAVGRAAVAALDSYEPKPVTPPGPVVVAVRCAVLGAIFTVGALGAIVIVQLALLLVGFRPDLGVSLRTVLLLWLVLTLLVWIARRQLPSVQRPVDQFGRMVPSPRGAADDEPRLLGTLPASEDADHEERATP
jgi:hypothetical protein